MKPRKLSNLTDKHLKANLSIKDKEYINNFGAILKGIAAAFGDNCEVILHSLEDPAHSCIMIENGHVTGRGVGSPLTDFAIEVLDKKDSLKSDIIGPYYSKANDGRMLKSVTILIRNPNEKLIGFMCINIDLSIPFLNFFREFLPVEENTANLIAEQFPTDIDELVGKTLTAIMNDNVPNEMTAPQKNRIIVKELYERGLFNIKGIVDIVANLLGISRYSVYNYLRDARLDMTITKTEGKPRGIPE